MQSERAFKRRIRKCHKNEGPVTLAETADVSRSQIFRYMHGERGTLHYQTVQRINKALDKLEKERQTK